MPSARQLFKDKDRIVKAIEAAEKQTSGEIRVHVEDHAGEDVMEHAQKLFLSMGMHETAASNGVLIYIASKDRKLAIIGDKELDKVVERDFWNQLTLQMSIRFKEAHYDEGVCEAIEIIGRQLKKYFPYHADTDSNELSDEISFGE